MQMPLNLPVASDEIPRISSALAPPSGISSARRPPHADVKRADMVRQNSLSSIPQSSAIGLFGCDAYFSRVSSEHHIHPSGRERGSPRERLEWAQELAATNSRIPRRTDRIAIQ